MGTVRAMRHPRLFTFLAWMGPGLIVAVAGIVTLLQSLRGNYPWAASLLDCFFKQPDGLALSGWFQVALGAFAIAYLAILARAHSKPPPAKRDIGVRQAFGFIVSGAWTDYATANLSGWYDLGIAWKHLNQAMRDGAVTVWGKDSRQGTFGKIDREFWDDHQVHFSALSVSETTTEKTQNSASSKQYWHLRLSKQEVRAAWPGGWQRRIRARWWQFKEWKNARGK